MAKKAPAIPTDVKNAALVVVEQFNEVNKKKYVLDFRGKFGYLMRIDNPAKGDGAKESIFKLYGQLFNMQVGPVETKIGRIEWTETVWDFVPYRYSRDSYDTKSEFTFFMPGRELLDGTIEGVLRAGMLLYPA